MLYHDVAFSPDTRLVASVCRQGTISLWDIETGSYRELHYQRFSHSISFSPDGRLLASMSEDKIRLWDVNLGSCTHTIPTGYYWTGKITFSPDGSYLRTRQGINSIPTRKQRRSAIFVNEEWVLVDGERILWLLLEYRPDYVEVSGDTICLGKDGSLTFLRFHLKNTDGVWHS